MTGIVENALTCGVPLSESSTEILENALHTPAMSPGTDDGTRSPQDVDDTEDTRVPFPVAVVGMAMRLPGGVSCEKEFWDFLVNKRDGLCKVPDTRYNIDAFHDDSRTGAIRTQHGYFLEHDIAQFDTGFFGISKAEAAKLDPQQRLLLEIIWECMENGGQTGWRGRNIGCYVGVFGEDWLDLKTKDTQDNDRYRVVGAGDYAISNRISYEYDLGGPSITFRTGCSSSLVGLHEACQGLYSGECSSALVAGTNLIFTPTMTTSMSDNMVISKSGICRTFDAAADGYGRGEAVNAIFIKPLDKALQDGDPVRAVIRSSAVNCDGKTPSITTPGSAAQERLIRRAYRKAGIDKVSQTAFFECHGTGTTVGDTSETSVVANVFGKEGIYIGAVKPNVGHSEGASGITSVIKGVLALENLTIPPNIHFQSPNPNIPFQKAKLQLPLEATAWPKDRRQRISINSFGIGGTNAHVILDSASPLQQDDARIDVDDQPDPRLLVLSARSKQSLDGQIENLQKYLETTKSSLSDIAYTLGLRREHMPHRAFALTEAGGKVSSFEKTKFFKAPIVFVFTGQGAQWPGMGRELIEKVGFFREDIRMMDLILQGVTNGPSWSIEDELLKCDHDSRVVEAEFAQPLCTAVQIALVNLLQHWGITPDAVVGHSSGEIAAAYASGALSAEVAILVAYFRGQAMKAFSSEHHGGMAAVGLGSEKARPFLKPGVVIACDNSPESVTLSGDSDTLGEVLNGIRAHDNEIFCRQLAVNVAYHSHHMVEAGEAYEKMIHPHCAHKLSMAPMYSTVSGTIISDPSILNARYWRKNLQSPVLFNTAIQRIIGDNDQPKLFLEIGPHSTLSGPIRQSLAKADTKDHRYLPTIIRGKEPWRSLLVAAGNLYTHSAPISLPSLIAQGKVLTELPPYTWQHDERLWDEPRLVRDWRLRRYPHHELLGSRTLESSDLEPAWRNVFSIEDALWVMDHKIGNDIVFPAAGYVAMAGEAVRQVTEYTDYSLRNMFIRNALVLEGSGPAEMVTSLRPVKLADNVDSPWFDFTITAYQNGKWKKHCVGQVRSGADQEHDVPLSQTYSRQIESDKWYRALKKRGLDYGSHFRGLKQITASPSTFQASAVLHGDEPPYSSYYALHPTLIDESLQLLSVAATQGISRRMTRMCIPTAIESLYISEGRGSMDLNVSCEATSGTMCGNSTLLSSDQVVLSMERGVFFSVQDPESNDPNALLASNIYWTRHIDFVPFEEQLPHLTEPLFRAQTVSKATSVYLVEAYRRTMHSAPTSDHLKKYHAWIRDQYRMIKEKSAYLVPEMKEMDVSKLGLYSPCTDALRREIRDMHPLVKHTHQLAERLCFTMHDILEGRISPLETLVKDDALRHFFEDMASLSPCDGFLQLLGQSNPVLRVLEIGAGTGGLTSIALNSLTLSNNGRLYSKYTFTDISGGFLADAQDKFRDYDAIEYATLDITRDPEGQGYTPESYDLIIAGNVIHATPRISDTLQNVRKLLAPGGRLLMQELSGNIPLSGFLMGVLPGWWLGEDDGRRDSPALSVERWHEELVNANFTGVDAVQYDNDKSYSMTATLLSTAKAPNLNKKERQIGLLHLSDISEWGRGLESALSLAGYTVKWYTLHDTPPPGSDIISLIDLEGPFFDNLLAEEFRLFQSYLPKLAGAHLLWITRTLQTDCEDPRFSLVLGMARTIRSELSHKFATLEVDLFDATAMDSAIKVFEKLKAQSNLPWLNSDYEYAHKDGNVLLPRLQWSSLEHQLAAAPHSSTPRSLDIGFNGILDSLRWAMSAPSPSELKEDEVELEIKYVGLNFKDMMIAMGFLGDTSELGIEGSGIVRRVGSSVEHIRVGDKVVVIYQGLLGTQKVVPAVSCQPVPEQMSLEDAAAISCIYATAIYCLITVGNLQKGQSVLIHSACGGVGLAAIQVCRMIGAEIYTTAGTSDKVNYLTDTVGIPADHIFDSRSTSFLQGVLKKTNGRGVDLVLNSLSGELLHASWKCVARFGKMVEIGKRDFMGHGKLDMDVFLGNRSFIGVDLSIIGGENQEALGGLVEQFTGYFRQGKLTPIRPVTVFDARDVVKAFRHMQTGQHIGKVVVRMPEDPNTLPISKIDDTTPLFKPDVSYLLVGGLGGLGRAISTWMVEKGARNFIFLSRSGGKSPEAQAFINDLENHNLVSATVIAGDVSNIEDIRRALSAAKHPIAGVLQMSMVLKDQMLSKMTYEDWVAALKPKVQGTWNLHFELQNVPLDFFVFFSSITGTMGFASQANYAAANTFLDSFVKYRHSQGLPASVIDLGFVTDIGYAAEQSPQTLNIVKTMDMQIIEEKDLLQALEISVFAQSPHPSSQLVLGLGTMGSVKELPWFHEGRLSRWQNSLVTNKAAKASQSHELQSLLDGIQENPRLLEEQSTHDRITIELGKLVAAHLAYAEDLSKEELSNIAIDSLMSIEIRSWFRRNAGIDISLVEISNAGTVGGLSDVAVKMLRKKYLDEGELPSGISASSPAEPDEMTMCLEDMKLGSDLRALPGTIPDWCSESEGRVFLTGATGFVGAFFLLELLALPQVKGVACLVRTTDPVSGRLRIEKTFTQYGLPLEALDKITVVPGNIAHPNLGMSKEEFDHHARSSSVVFHLGAFVNYTLPYSAHRDANIFGFLNILEFVNTGRLKPLNYFSSIGACGASAHITGTTIPENGRATLDPKYFEQHVGYTRSKLAAESIAWNAIANRLPITIYRPGVVMGHSGTGVDKPEDLFNRLMYNCIRLGAYPAPPQQRNHFVPVDYICAAVLHISQSSENQGHAFNVVHPNQDQTITWMDTFKILSEYGSTPLKCVSAAEWLQMFTERGKHSMKIATPLLKERLADNEIWWGDSSGMAAYETTNLCRALADSPDILDIKPMPELLKVYYGRWEAGAVDTDGAV